MLIIFLSAVITAVLLRRQERVHQAELAGLYQQLGRSIPLPKPKLRSYECWLSLAAGGILAIVGTMNLVFGLVAAKVGIPTMQESWQGGAVFLAFGITVYVLGLRALQENKRYNNLISDQEKT
jgi:sugar phosphate permease